MCLQLIRVTLISPCLCVAECPKEAPVAAIVGGTVAAVVLIPLLIICLIIFIRNRRDAKEYADFMKERDRAKWDSVSFLSVKQK